MLLLLDEYQSMQFPTATKKSIWRIRWKLDKWKTSVSSPSLASKHWMAFHWRLRKIETNGFGGKCDATSSKNRGWLLTNERLCHLGQITQQINGKEKENIWKVGVSSEKRRILQNAQIAKFSKRFKTQSVSWKATENHCRFLVSFTDPRPTRRPMGIKKCKGENLRWGILIQHHGYSVARLDRKLWFSMKNLYLYI